MEQKVFIYNDGFEPSICDHCHQTTDYALAIDRGTVQIVKQIARFIGQKKINVVHPRDEMEGSLLTSNEVGNLTRARAHGLIAKVKGNPGNYCLTTKGADFLHGMPIQRTAIRSKVEHKTIGYTGDQVTINDFNQENDYWEGVGYDIKEGHVVSREPQQINLF